MLSSQELTSHKKKKDYVTNENYFQLQVNIIYMNANIAVCQSMDASHSVLTLNMTQR